jgi:hypothetical protein
MPERPCRRLTWARVGAESLPPERAKAKSVGYRIRPKDGPAASDLIPKGSAANLRGRAAEHPPRCQPAGQGSCCSARRADTGARRPPRRHAGV